MVTITKYRTMSQIKILDNKYFKEKQYKSEPCEITEYKLLGIMILKYKKQLH